MATTYEAIATVTVGSGGAASIDFTSIPATFTNLVILMSCRRSLSTGTGQMSLTFNGSSSGYSSRMLEGTGSSAGSNSYSGVNMRIGQAEPSNFTANTFMNTQIYIPNYASSNNKSVSSDSVSENNATEAYAAMFAGLWSNTAAITSISLFPADINNWAQHSSATLYGIKNS
jgi:hypothetical protein